MPLTRGNINANPMRKSVQATLFLAAAILVKGVSWIRDKQITVAKSETYQGNNFITFNNTVGKSIKDAKFDDTNFIKKQTGPMQCALHGQY